MDAQERISEASPLARQAVALMLHRLAAEVEEALDEAEGTRNTDELRLHLGEQLDVLWGLDSILLGRPTLLGVE